MAACFRINLQSASTSNNGAGGINLGPMVGGRRPPSQQSFHSSKNNHSHHSRHQTTSAPPSTPRNACQQPEIAARCIRKYRILAAASPLGVISPHNFHSTRRLDDPTVPFHLSLSSVFHASDAVDDDSCAVLRLPLVGQVRWLGNQMLLGFISEFTCLHVLASSISLFACILICNRDLF